MLDLRACIGAANTDTYPHHHNLLRRFQWLLMSLAFRRRYARNAASVSRAHRSFLRAIGRAACIPTANNVIGHGMRSIARNSALNVHAIPQNIGSWFGSRRLVLRRSIATKSSHASACMREPIAPVIPSKQAHGRKPTAPGLQRILGPGGSGILARALPSRSAIGSGIPSGCALFIRNIGKRIRKRSVSRMSDAGPYNVVSPLRSALLTGSRPKPIGITPALSAVIKRVFSGRLWLIIGYPSLRRAAQAPSLPIWCPYVMASVPAIPASMPLILLPGCKRNLGSLNLIRS
jgi:hypothetical protein